MRDAPRTLRLTASLFAVAALVAGCRAEAVLPEPTDVTLQLKWIHQAQFAGYYLADAEGLYASRGLRVTLLEGGPEVDVVAAIADGRADFGVTSPEQLIIARSAGTDVVAVAAIVQVNPLVFVALPESGIRSPKDFPGRTMALDAQATVQLRAVMARLGLDPGSVTIVAHDITHAGLLAGDVDATFAYASGGLVRLQQARDDVVTIWPSEYGIRLYADVLVTTQDRIESDPDGVGRFVEASLAGWTGAVERPHDAVEATLELAQGTTSEQQTEMMEASVPLIHTGVAPIGTMESATWEAMNQLLLDEGVIAEPIDISEAFTTRFLEPRDAGR